MLITEQRVYEKNASSFTNLFSFYLHLFNKKFNITTKLFNPKPKKDFNNYPKPQ